MAEDPQVSESKANRSSQEGLTREGFSHDEKMLAAQQAYQKSMDELSRSKGAELMESGEDQLMQGTSAAPPELQQIMKDYADNNLLGQTEARKSAALNLENAGVRGGQAATLMNRASGDLNRELSSDINKLAYDDAINRRSERNKYASGKASMGASGYAR